MKLNIKQLKELIKESEYVPSISPVDDLESRVDSLEYEVRQLKEEVGYLRNLVRNT